jgi:uncharacterized protein
MIVDADAHVSETLELFERFLDPAYPRPTLLKADMWGQGWFDFGGGRFVPRREGAGRGPIQGFAAGPERNDVEARRRFIAEEGIDVQVVYPTNLIAVCSFDDRDYASALARAYNDWVADYCRQCGPDQVKAVAIVALQEPAEAIEELRRAVDELGLVGVVIPSMIGDRLLGEEQFLPFFAEAERLDCMVGLHDVTGAYDLPGQQMFSTFFGTKIVARPFAFMTAALSLMNVGLLERYPRLRVAFLENGVGWLTYWLERMDHFYEDQRARGFIEQEVPYLKQPPSAYVQRGQIFCHAEPEERTLADSIAYLGENVCFYASDFPHEEVHGSELTRIRQRADISQRAKDAILSDNPLRLYGPRLTAPAAARAASATA